VLIDAGHHRWIVVCLGLLVVAAAAYVPYWRASLNGPTGGSVPGLIYGLAGFVLIVYAGLLGARRRVPAWRIGRASAWMRGHLWLGLLSYPLIWLHAGGQLGGVLTIVLMVLFTIIVLSGVYGVYLQQSLPRAMTAAVPLETIFEEIDSRMAGLHEQADDLVAVAVGPVRARPPEAEALQETYRNAIEPYLSGGIRDDGRLGGVLGAAAVFDHLRTTLPPALHDTVNALAALCEERRQLALQKRLHHRLHGWLFLHVPLSVALLLLALVHVVVSVWH
jgi:hypothetical protein